MELSSSKAPVESWHEFSNREPWSSACTFVCFEGIRPCPTRHQEASVCAALLYSRSQKTEFLFKVVPRVIQARAADPGKHQPVRSRTDVLAAAAFVERWTFFRRLRKSLGAFYSTATLWLPSRFPDRLFTGWSPKKCSHTHTFSSCSLVLLGLICSNLKEIPSTSPSRCHFEPLSFTSRVNAAKAGNPFHVF